MKHPKGTACHKCAPSDWKTTPNMTGDFEFDASVIHAKAKRLNTDLAHHIKGSIVNTATAYGGRTMYNGYDGYHGDD